MMAKRTQKQIEDLCESLLEDEHGGCNDNTCDLSAAMSNGYSRWAMHLWANGGAASDEFMELYNQLGPAHHKAAAKECDDMCANVEHEECEHCRAVCWDIGSGGLTYDGVHVACASCDKDFVSWQYSIDVEKDEENPEIYVVMLVTEPRDGNTGFTLDSMRCKTEKDIAKLVEKLCEQHGQNFKTIHVEHIY